MDDSFEFNCMYGIMSYMDYKQQRGTQRELLSVTDSKPWHGGKLPKYIAHSRCLISDAPFSSFSGRSSKQMIVLAISISICQGDLKIIFKARNKVHAVRKRNSPLGSSSLTEVAS